MMKKAIISFLVISTLYCATATYSREETRLINTDPSVCEGCKEGFNWLKEKLLSTEVDKAVKDTINYICQRTPLQKECVAVLNKVYEEFLSNVNKMNPEGVCEAMHMCPEKHDYFQLSFPEISCDTCKKGIKDAIKMLENPEILGMLNSALKQACDAIPSDNLKEECLKVFSGTFEEWVKALVQRIDGEKLCELLGFCEAKYYRKYTFTDSKTCDTCVEGIEKLRDLIDSEEFVKHVKEALNKACAITIYYVQECQKAVNDSLDKLFDMIKKTSGRQVCQKLYLCE